jgi:hypothetical protein
LACVQTQSPSAEAQQCLAAEDDKMTVSDVARLLNSSAKIIRVSRGGSPAGGW